MKYYFFAIAFLLIRTIYAQHHQELTDLTGDYLGQEPPGDSAVVFAPGVVSKDGAEHSAAVFSSDGNEVYWSTGKLYHMHRINNTWTHPRVIKIIEGDNIPDQPFLSHDGKRLYFNSRGRETKKEGITPQQWTRYYNEDIWYVEKEGNGWSKARGIDSLINNDYNQALASLNNKNTLYYLTYMGGVDGECGIYRSIYNNGRYSEPEALPECINLKSQDWTPFIAPDDSYLIFSSYREGGYGQGDLYISFHDTIADTWTEPVNMGNGINTGVQERFPAVSPDGKYIFFTRWTEENGHDIFWVSVTVINKLKSKNQKP